LKPSLRKIGSRRVTDEIVEQVVCLILNGELQAGDRLPTELQLAERFGVGRSSVREAMRALSLAGIVRTQRGRGTHVMTAPDTLGAGAYSWSLMIEHSKVEDILEARRTLEVPIAGLAAKRATEQDILRAKGINEQLGLSRGKRRKRAQSDVEFHLALAEAAHNPILTRFFSELQQVLQTRMKRGVAASLADDSVVEQHAEIIAAIEAHDTAAAESTMRRHLEWVSGQTGSSLRERTIRPRRPSKRV
jgi:GntR family transcriptional repressor for pyruvate dehydrogenase complex